MGYPPPGGGYPGGYGGPPGAPPGADPTLWNWFMTCDRDKSGQITANELQQALLNGNWSHFNSETCRLMIGMCFQKNSLSLIHPYPHTGNSNFITSYLL